MQVRAPNIRHEHQLELHPEAKKPQDSDGSWALRRYHNAILHPKRLLHLDPTSSRFSSRRRSAEMMSLARDPLSKPHARKFLAEARFNKKDVERNVFPCLATGQV